MPATSTLAGWERRIQAFADEHHMFLSRTEVRRAAKHFRRRAETCHDPDLDMRVLGFLVDPTPTEALHNIAHDVNARAAARRLGLVAS